MTRTNDFIDCLDFPDFDIASRSIGWGAGRTDSRRASTIRIPRVLRCVVRWQVVTMRRDYTSV
jgi:hypothetical protein